MNRAWNLHKKRHEDKLISTKCDHNIYMKRAWDQDQDSMISTWRKQEIYIRRAWDMHKEIMGSTWRVLYIKIFRPKRKREHGFTWR